VRARGKLPVDIIVVDDGSTDLTEETLYRFDVRYIKGEHNMGQSWARNHGAALTDTAYILFIDSDVVVREDCFQQIEEFITMDKPNGLIGLQGVFSLEHPYQEWPSLIYNTLQHLLSREPRYSPGVNTSFFLVRRQDFMDIGGFREDMWFMEDNEFAQRTTAMGKYALRGQIEFVHRKRVTWSWLIRTHILGGKTQYILSRMKPKPVSNTSGLPGEVGVNRVFLRWLFTGTVTIAAVVLLALINHPYLRFGITIVVAIAWLQPLADSTALFKVKRNPFFVLVGTLAYMLLPWLIVIGRLIGRFASPGKRDRKRWKGTKVVEPPP
jgi:glycosyltransferase involved in cell wall biosynthesis